MLLLSFDVCQLFSKYNFFKMLSVLNSLFADDDFCHLLITFTNSLDPDQDRHVDPRSGPTCRSWSAYTVFNTLMALDIFVIVNFEKKSADYKH